MLAVDTQSPSGERVESVVSPSFNRVEKETDSQLRVTGSNAIVSARLSDQSAKADVLKRNIFYAQFALGWNGRSDSYSRGGHGICCSTKFALRHDGAA
jgi:hypothetical protein